MITAIEIPYYFKEVLATDFYHSDTAQTQGLYSSFIFFDIRRYSVEKKFKKHNF